MNNTRETSTPMARPKVLAVASFGGHFVQLMRITRPLSDCDVSYVSTAAEAMPSGTKAPFHVIGDFSRSNPWKLLKSIWNCRKIIKSEKPDLVISTGAAPGLSAILMARLMGIRTLWVDSIANAERLSMCGKIASRFATQTLTQWPHLAKGNVKFSGTVL